MTGTGLGMGERDTAGTRGNLWQQAGPLCRRAETRHHIAGEKGVRHRAGHQGAPELFEDQCHVNQAQSGALFGLGDEQRLQAQATQALPQRGVPLARCGTQFSRSPLVRQEAPDAVAQQVLVRGEIEVHAGLYLGRPSTRSAMMLRCISEVPE